MAMHGSIRAGGTLGRTRPQWRRTTPTTARTSVPPTSTASRVRAGASPRRPRVHEVGTDAPPREGPLEGTPELCVLPPGRIQGARARWRTSSTPEGPAGTRGVRGVGDSTGGSARGLGSGGGRRRRGARAARLVLHRKNTLAHTLTKRTGRAKLRRPHARPHRPPGGGGHREDPGMSRIAEAQL